MQSFDAAIRIWPMACYLTRLNVEQCRYQTKIHLQNHGSKFREGCRPSRRDALTRRLHAFITNGYTDEVLCKSADYRQYVMKAFLG